MWATGVYDLGLTDAQFWALTPRQYDLLANRFLDAEERASQRFGLLATLYANAHRDREKHPHPFELQDFAPSRNGTHATVRHKPDHCSECGLHVYYGHAAECKHGQSVLQYHLSLITEAEHTAGWKRVG